MPRLAIGNRFPRTFNWRATALLSTAVLMIGASTAPGAGTVGTGTPASCTEAALDAALTDGGNVAFNCGANPVTITVTSTKTIGTATAIDGGGRITISGGHSVGVFTVLPSASFTVQGLTIADGNAAYGGGIFSGGNLTVTNAAFTGNHADNNGGAIDSEGPLSVTNSTFSDNHAADGFGGGLYSADTLTVTGTTFSNNTGIDGGGLDSEVGPMTLTNCTFSDNQATGPTGSGGGIFSDGAPAVIANSTFSGNRAVYDGAGLGTYGPVTVTNCTFSNNIADSDYGGGIFAADAVTVIGSTFSANSAIDGGGLDSEVGPLVVINSTFSGNTATGDAGSGGGIFTYGLAQTDITNCTFSDNDAVLDGAAIYNDTGPLTLTNTIVAGNTSTGNCGGTMTDGGHNLDADGSCDIGPATDPLLDPAGLANNGGPTRTIALQAASPAINAGDNAVCAAAPVNGIDQRGYVRPGTGATACSVGAFEHNGIAPGPPTCAGDCDGTGSVTVEKILTLVNITLGSAEPSACPQGIPSGANVDIALIIQAVNNALAGCSASAV